MVNERNVQTVYTESGNPDTLNVSTLYRPGELGAVHEKNDRTYQRVRLDTGSTAAPASGVVAANELAYWKDKSTYLVTNDREQAQGGSGTGSYQNRTAGVFRNAVTAGNYCDVLQRGRAINLADGGNTFAVGEIVIAEADSVGAANRLSVGTAATHMALGFARGAASGGVVSVDVDIPSIP